MKRQYWMIVLIALLVGLVACSNGDNEEKADNEEPIAIEVEFDVPEAVDANETIELEAVVTHGDELVVDADGVKFEYWAGDDEDNSTTVEGENNEDGTYTSNVTFTEDGVYTLYAHTDAKGQHTMPKRQIVVGDAEITEDDDHDSEEHHHTEGFSMDFSEPNAPAVDQEVKLATKIDIDEEPLEDADVRYEIWNNKVEGEHEWIDSEEINPGEYESSHKFTEEGNYTIQIHVEDDEDLHEHEEFKIDVSE